MTPDLLLWLTDDTRQRIVETAEAVHPREACGIIAGGNMVVLTNIAADDVAHRSFETDPIEVRQAVESAGGWSAIRAVWHSHPDVDGREARPYPSDVDVANHPIGPVMIIAAGGECYGWKHSAH